ncbi:intermembrane phospholipid transport protein YdbH family protein [Hwanghaeella grinnelliae]|nr:YdbH domain-containing protein [Hwanghaeella grinnelliae]
MRRLGIALAAFFLLALGATVLAWVNRIPLAEWAIDTYQSETPLGPVSVRISDISLSSVTIAEIRARYRGPIAMQDITADFEIGRDWNLNLPSVRIGSLNAALSFADWFDLLDTIGSGDPGAGETGLPTFSVSVGAVSVETIDLYAETPKGYALLNGDLAFDGPIDFSQPTALAQLADGLDGTLLLSAGAAGFPVKTGAMGGGSLVLTATFADNLAKVEAIAPLRLNLEVSEPLPTLPNLPVGTYRADIGSDELPFRMSVGYGVDPAPALRTLILAPFPFALDTPFGTASANATTAPMQVDEAQADPTALHLGMKGELKLSGLPLPSGMKADISGGFEFDKGNRTSIALAKGFKVSLDVSASPTLADLPQAAQDMLGDTLSLATQSKVEAVLAESEDAIVGEGAMTLSSGAVTAGLPSGFALELTPKNEMKASTEAFTLALSQSKAPIAVTADLNTLSMTVAADGTMRAQAGYRIETDQGQSSGSFSVARTDDETTVDITDAEIALPGSDMTIPSFRATGRMAGDGVELSATVDEIRQGELRALKRPLSLTGKMKLEDPGFDFNMSGAVDEIISVSAKGTYADGDIVMTFGSKDIPLGPDGLDLSELTDLVDLGRSDPNGSIRVEGELTYQHDAISGYADLHIAEIGSVLTDGTEVSILGTVTFDLSRLPATMSPATLTGTLSSDILGNIPFEETFTLRETGEMVVQSLEAQFLGGTITLSEGLASASAGTLDGLIHASAIDLNALAVMMNIEGLGGTGRLTGDLKFKVKEDAVIVEGGELSAEEPGMLRYKGEALSAAANGNENLALLVQALENFHYKVLTLGIDIPEYGEGVVTLHLEGNNPDVLEGYPFDVTINLESEYGRLIKTFLNLYNEMDVILQGALR